VEKWKELKAWSDKYLPEIKRHLGAYLISEPKDITEDSTHNTDLVVLELKAVRIACRIRKDKYRERYGNQFTIRSGVPSRNKTELAKIVEGWGDYIFYGFADDFRLTQWFIGDLKAFRLWFNSEIIKRKGELPGTAQSNLDGSSDFRAFDKDAIPTGGCMKELMKRFNGHRVRVIIQKGIEWFVAKDVCDILEIKNVSSALETIQDKHKTTIGLSDTGSNYKHNALCVNEAGLYKLIFKSRKPEAETFQDWVYEEVLPSIRKTGKYDIRDIKKQSTQHRNMVTDQWQRQGVTHSWQYGSLTKEEYKQLYGDPDKKKAEMDKSEILKLSAFEAVEAWKLSEVEENILGYNGCKTSITETAGLLEVIKQRKAIA